MLLLQFSFEIQTSNLIMRMCKIKQKCRLYPTFMIYGKIDTVFYSQLKTNSTIMKTNSTIMIYAAFAVRICIFLTSQQITFCNALKPEMLACIKPIYISRVQLICNVFIHTKAFSSKIHLKE